VGLVGGASTALAASQLRQRDPAPANPLPPQGEASPTRRLVDEYVRDPATGAYKLARCLHARPRAGPLLKRRRRRVTVPRPARLWAACAVTAGANRPSLPAPARPPPT
jgi:hypothetical protein